MEPQAIEHPAGLASGAATLAATIVRPGRVELREVELAPLGPSQVLIRLEGCGLCASSLPIYEGRDWFSYPQEPGSPGHEGWGVVEEVGEDVIGLAPGDRVAALSNRAFATHDMADASGCVALPQALNGQPFPGEALGCAINIFERCRIEAGHTVAVVGSGFLGCLLMQLAVAAGARVLAASRRDSSLDAALRSGADAAVRIGDDPARALDEVRRLTGGHGCDVVVEATGKQAPLDLAAELVATRGTLVIAGFHQDGLRTVNMQSWNWRGIDVINAHEREQERYVSGIRGAVEAIADGRMDPQPLLTHALPLAELGEAFELLRSRPDGFIKAYVTTG